ncbi:alpha/beta hydrolase [Acinetobacter sp. A3.8]|uniref:Alpha/beta hydrolase n=1 Tax=Acinetobacter sedimenti TaxID=2919922 RepID=A0A9X1WXI8_9GAMM|nr:alpha/beta hydrolase [Acinetobacter sedimenti]MCJ8145682.1 alpha/beta hydrolase [Acinetobacter sedimenti]
MSKLFDLQKLMLKTQGHSAKAIDRAPKPVQRRLARMLGYHYPFAALHPFYQCILAVQHKQGHSGFVKADYRKSRKLFLDQMTAFQSNPTKIAQVKDLHLPLDSGMTPARHYHPNPKQTLPMIVFYHGGGFVVGGLNTHDEACRLLAKHANVQVLSIDYPLAPEHSPQQLIKCCVEALQWAFEHQKEFNIAPNRIAIAGDSAGGNISAVVAQVTKDQPFAPQSQLLIYPAVDFKSRYSSFYKYKDGLVLTGEDIDHVTAFYPDRHEVELDDPIISPLFGKLEGLAPAYVMTAEFDVLHDEGELYSQKLKHAGVKTHFVNIADQPHGFINMTTIHQSAKQHWINTAKSFRQFWNTL